jgi:hypothetical protein
MHTYVITDPTTVRGFTGVVVTDARTGRTFAASSTGLVPLGTPLCDGCDLPVSDGPCDCAAPSEAERSNIYSALIAR